MKDKEESRRNAVAFQDFLTLYFAVRTSKKIQELVGGAIIFTAVRTTATVSRTVTGISKLFFCAPMTENMPLNMAGR